jgi:hypothetical protein
MNQSSSQGDAEQYEIRIEGHVGDIRARTFGGMRVEPHPNGETVISGPIPDQAALFGLLIRIRDLGIPLISLNRMDKT